MRSRSLVPLWIIVSALWTIATGLRIDRTWVPIVGWPAVLSSAFTWTSLFIPPLMFAIILLAIKRIADAGNRIGPR
jgi:hypothetical protein